MILPEKPVSTFPDHTPQKNPGRMRPGVLMICVFLLLSEMIVHAGTDGAEPVAV
jgi:hypothetical protein